jgi:hypothetical protein
MLSKPFRRTFRPNDVNYFGYITDERCANSLHQYVRAFEILQKDMLELFDYVEPADANSQCYSYRIHELHTRACIEVEANCKAILSENSYPRNIDDLKMTDYKKLQQTHHLSAYEVNFEKSNLRNMVDTMCGLVAVLASQFFNIDFGPEGYVGDHSEIPLLTTLGSVCKYQAQKGRPNDDWLRSCQH